MEFAVVSFTVSAVKTTCGDITALSWQTKFQVTDEKQMKWGTFFMFLFEFCCVCAWNNCGKGTGRHQSFLFANNYTRDWTKKERSSLKGLLKENNKNTICVHSPLKCKHTSLLILPFPMQYFYCFVWEALCIVYNAWKTSGVHQKEIIVVHVATFLMTLGISLCRRNR